MVVDERVECMHGCPARDILGWGRDRNESFRSSHDVNLTSRDVLRADALMTVADCGGSIGHLPPWRGGDS